MRLHTVLFSPLRLTASTLIKMAFFRADHANIAGSQFFKARITMTTIKAFFGFTATASAMNNTLIIQADFLANKVIQQYFFTIGIQQPIVHWIGLLGGHFAQAARENFVHRVSSTENRWTDCT